MFKATMPKAVMSKASTAIVSLLFVAYACVLHPASGRLAAAGIVSALLLALLLIVMIARLDWRPGMRRGRQLLRYAIPVLLVPLGCGLSWASFSLTFQGLVQTLNTGGSITLNTPEGIVVDTAGNIYIVDHNNNRIVEVNALGVASVVAITGLSPALLGPTAIAIDGSGNLYVADTGNNRVVEITAAGAGSAIGTPSITLSFPQGVALDQSGDIFIADTGNNRIVEVAAGGAASVLFITVASGSATLSSPVGLAVDVTGKLYIADANNNRIVTLAAGATTGAVVPILGGVTLSLPQAVAVDHIGNVIIADALNDRIVEVDTSGNGTVLFTGSATLNGPEGVALDVFGTVYIADTSHNRALVVDPPVNGDLTSSDPTYSLNKTAVGFGHVPLGSSTAVTLTLPFTTGGSGGLGGVAVLTSGVQSLDFTSGTDTTCNSSTGPSTECSVEVSFLPTAPGLRNGSVVLYDTGMNPILTVPLYAWGDAPVAALSPNPGLVVSIGGVSLSDPFQVALDGAGNMYVGDYANSNVVKIPAGGGTGTLVALGTPGGTAPQSITGVAVDGAGNLFIGDHINSRILAVTPGGVVSVLTINGLSPAIELPTALAFDAAGNLYIADYGGGRVVRVSTLVVAGSTSSGLGVALGTGVFTFGISTLSGTTVDAQGNIYIAARTENSSSIIKVTTAGVASELSFPGITPPLSGPQGVAVDAMGTVYVVDSGNNRIVRLTTAGMASALSISGLPAPPSLGSSLFGVTLDPWGNLYIPDWTNNRIVFANVSGAVLAFPTTDVGSSSSPQTATVANLGDLPLIFATVPSYTVNFSEDTGDENLCALSTSLVAGTLCDVSVEFTPQSAGSLSAGIVVTNNGLNVTGMTQNVAVSGTGTLTTTSTALAASPNPAVAGQSVLLTASVSPTPVGSPLGSVSFYNGATLLGSSNLDSSGIATFATSSLAVGADSLIAIYSGNVSFAASTSSLYTETITSVTSTTTALTATPNPATVGQSIALTATVTPVPVAPGLARPRVPEEESSLGSVSFFFGETLLGSGNLNSSGVATLATTSLPAGADHLTAVYSGDNGFATSTSSIFTETITAPTSTTTTLTTAPNPAQAGQSVTLTATISPPPTGSSPGTVSFYDGDTLLGAGNVSSAGVAVFSITTLPAGANTLTAVYSGNSSFATSTSSGVTQTVTTAIATTTILTASPNPASSGGAVTFTVSVSPAPTGTALGTVSFYSGSTLLGTASVNSSGVATFTSTTLATGALSITAVYSGNTGFAGSTSASLTETVSTTYTVSAPPAPVTVTEGGSVEINVTVPPIGGAFNNMVTMSASGLPPGATATFNPPTVTPGSAGAPTIMTIQLAALTANSVHSHRNLASLIFALGLCGMGFGGKRFRRKSKRGVALLVLAFAASSSLACGGGFLGPPTTQAGSYVVTITGTSGAAQVSTTVTVVVQ